jgi:hypothetical protein
MKDKNTLKVRLIVADSVMDMTFEKDDDELVDITVKWVEKKLKARLSEMKEAPNE